MASPDTKLEFLTKGFSLVLFAIFCFVCAGIGSALIIRLARKEFEEGRTENLKELIEGTQEDIKNNQQNI